MKDLNAIFVFWVEYRRELPFPRVGVFEAVRDENYVHPVATLLQIKKYIKKRWKIQAVNASWKKVKCLYLYSTDTAFAQHKHDKYSLQSKGQIPAN